MKANVTMRDIAARLGVSVVTVSKALNDKEGVSEELKEKIKALADEMGYRVNALAKAMKEGHSYNIGVIVAERYTGSTESFYMQFYQFIAKSLEDLGYSGILHILSEEDEEQLKLPRIYHERKVDGLILLGQLQHAYIERLIQADAALVCLDFYTDQSDLDCVITDNFYGVYEMTNYLINRGHREIGFIGNVHTTSSIQDRFLGYYKSLLEHRIPLREDWIVNDRDDRGKFIDFELPEQLPSAFVCNCDRVAFNLIQALNDRGYRVPEDCSVVGFDNDIFAMIANPPLTTVAVDMPEMARVAVDCMINKLKHANAYSGRVLVKGNLVVRDSVQKRN